MQEREIKEHELVAVYLVCLNKFCKYEGIKCLAPEVELKEI